MNDSSPPATPRPLALGSALILLAIAIYWRLQGADPLSLRLDDQWLGIVCSKFALGDFLELRPPVPAGFAALQSLAARLSADPEWPLQVIPILASLVQLPLMVLLVMRTTGRPTLAFFGGAMLLANPNIAQYAVTPKHYTVDAAVTVGLLAIAIPWLQKWRMRQALVCILAGLAAPLLSFPSTFVSLAIVNAASWLGLVRGGSWRQVALLWTGFHAAMGMIYWFLLRTQSNAAMQLYWADHFLGWESVAAEQSLATITPWWAIAGAFPGALQWIAVLSLLGLAASLIHPDRRSIGLCLAVFFGGLLLAAALEIYPLGAGRTDIYSYPVSILAAVLCVEWLYRLPRIQPLVRVVVFGLGTATLLCYGSLSQYEDCQDAELAHLLDDRAEDGDLVVIYPHAEFAVGYYTDWRFHPRKTPVYAHGFELQFERQNTLKLPPPDLSPGYPDLVEQQLNEFLEPGRRVFYIATHIYPPGHEFVRSVIERHRLEPLWVIDRPGGQLICYVPK